MNRTSRKRLHDFVLPQSFMSSKRSLRIRRALRTFHSMRNPQHRSRTRKPRQLHVTGLAHDNTSPPSRTDAESQVCFNCRYQSCKGGGAFRRASQHGKLESGIELRCTDSVTGHSPNNAISICKFQGRLSRFSTSKGLVYPARPGWLSTWVDPEV